MSFILHCSVVRTKIDTQTRGRKKTPSGVSLVVEFEASQLEAMPLSRLAPQPNQIGVMEVIWADPSRDWKICTTASPWIGLGSGTVVLHLKR